MAILVVFNWIIFCAGTVFAGIICVLAIVLGYIKYKQSQSKKYMEQFQGRSECIPLLEHMNIHMALTRTAKECQVDYGVLLFEAAVAFHDVYPERGYYHIYVGTTPVISICRADLVEDALSNTKSLKKSIEYGLLHPWLGQGLLTSNGSKWKSHRKMLTPAFHFRILDDFVPMINHHARILTSVLADRKPDSDMHIVPYITYCTLDIICETVMGVSVNAQKGGNSEYVKNILAIGESFVLRLTSPSMWLDTLFKMQKLGRDYFSNLDKLHEFTRKVIQTRLDELENVSLEEMEQDLYSENTTPTKSKKPFLDLLLYNHKKFPQELSLEDVREEVDTFMFEGHDTTSMGLTYAIFLLGLHPEVQQKIHAELDTIFGDDTECDITLEHIKQMKYLDMTIKESQRLYPSVPGVGRVTEYPMTLGGREVPAGVNFHVIFFALHRDPKVFPKPEEFDPDRFLPENCKGRHPFAFVPFSAGPRNCIGQRFALIEEKIVLATILRKFYLKSLDPRDRLLVAFELVLRPKSKVRVALIPRRKS